MVSFIVTKQKHWPRIYANERELRAGAGCFIAIFTRFRKDAFRNPLGCNYYIGESDGHRFPPAAFSTRRAFWRLMRESVRHYGTMRTFREVVSAVYRPFARSVAGPPSHSLWDLDFDFERNVDTRAPTSGFVRSSWPR